MNAKLTRREALRVLSGAGCCAAAGCRGLRGGVATANGRWYRGNLHMHSYWSDGRAFPEQAVGLYKELGYDFIALTEHNVFADNPACWRPVLEKEAKWPPDVTRPLFDAYRQAWAREAEVRQTEGKEEVRLKTYAEMRRRFYEPGRFLLMPGVEITQTVGGIQVHMNYLNLPDVIPFVKGGALNKKADGEVGGVSELIGVDAREVAALSERLRRPTMLTLNHPQWVYWDIQPQNLIDNPAVRFFEVCNGGSAFAPHPDARGVTNDRFWDTVNAFRCLKGQPMLYGIGTDDTHYYLNRKPDQRLQDAWVMVRGEALTAEALLAAMQAGDFYASTGVTLEDVRFDARERRLSVRVRPEPGVTYRIRFITTKRGFDQAVRTVESPAEKGRGARSLAVYSDDVGRTASLAEGVAAEYRLAPDDLYVRAKVESSVPSGYERHFHPEVQVAWTQPYGAV